jgi:hypothetical protein
MLSTVDTATQQENGISENFAAVANAKQVSTGVSVCQLRSGLFAVSVHDGDRRAIVELTADELRGLARTIAAFPALVEP